MILTTHTKEKEDGRGISESYVDHAKVLKRAGVRMIQVVGLFCFV